MIKESPAGPTPLRRLAERSVGLFALTLCFVAAGLVVYDLIRRTHFDYLENFSQFTGGQLYVAVATAGVVIVAVAVAAVLFRRRRPLPPGVPGHSQVFWALFAITLGVLVGAVSDRGTRHVLDWASSHTAAAHRAEAELLADRRQVLGDATHPPQLRNFGSPASAQQAAPLLTPADLGGDWHYTGTPPVTVAHPTTPPGDATPTSRVTTYLVAEHWNGALWTHDQDVLEIATRYATVTGAKRAIREDLDATEVCNLPSACTPATPAYQSTQSGRTQVWRQPVSDRYALSAVLLDGTMLMRVRCFSSPGATGPRLTASQILRDAVMRAQAAR